MNGGNIPSAGGYAKGYKDLDVYRMSREAAALVFKASIRFPKEEAYSLTDQVRRSSRSIGAQIAEAWAKRRYERHFVSKLTDAVAEQAETQHWVEVACDCGYLSPAERDNLMDLLDSLGRMLGSMINKAPSFCAATSYALREELAEYSVTGET